MSARTLALRTVIAAAALTTVLAPGLARAQAEENITRPRPNRYESPQHFAFELRFGPYRPDIDSDPNLGGQTPYNDFFGNSKDPSRGDGTQLLGAIEVDYQALRIPFLGTIGAGLSAGFTQANGVAYDKNTDAPSGTSTLQMFPFYGVGVLRVDALLRELKVPLVPYAKAGVGMALWRSSNQVSTSSAVPNEGDKVNESGLSVGEGTTWGTHFAAGIALELNWIDSQAGRGFDTAYGVNHSYAYVELMHMGLDGFGNGTSLILRDTTWAAGLAVEF